MENLARIQVSQPNIRMSRMQWKITHHTKNREDNYLNVKRQSTHPNTEKNQILELS